jgi:hypothetical protein
VTRRDLISAQLQEDRFRVLATCSMFLFRSWSLLR